MGIIDNLLYGFSISLQSINLLHCLAGVFIGTPIGVLPGIKPVASISIEEDLKRFLKEADLTEGGDWIHVMNLTDKGWMQRVTEWILFIGW